MSLRKKYIVLLIIYIAVILYITVLSRDSGERSAEFALFWSYREWLNGETALGIEILENIAMSIPLGFIVMAVVTDINYEGIGVKKFIVTPLLVCLVLTTFTELCQLVFKLGMFEFDDIYNNLLGGIIGGLIFCFMYRGITNKLRLDKMVTALCVVFDLVGILVCKCGEKATEILMKICGCW